MTDPQQPLIRLEDLEDTEATAHTTSYQLGSWQEFQDKVASFEDTTRKLWDEVWFRGQACADWPLHFPHPCNQGRCIIRNH
jgi:hypothetical protein